MVDFSDAGDIGDLLSFISGLVLFAFAVIILILFTKYRRRNYLLAALGLFFGALQLTVQNLEIFFYDDWDDEVVWPSVLAGIIGVLIVIIIGLILFFPERVPINFEEELVEISSEGE